MEVPVSIIQPLANRTVMVPPSAAHELESEIVRHGARVLCWPPTEILAPQNCAAIDEAIESLYGYDWIIFANGNAAESFIRRFEDLGHEVSELDVLRVCAIGPATARKLEDSQIHIDLPTNRITSEAVFEDLEIFAGGSGSLRGLNFLLPRAPMSRDRLPQALEDAGARADLVSAYRTAGAHSSELARLNVLIESGGIDCIVFTTPASVQAFSEVFDTNDPLQLLREVAVVCADTTTASAAVEFGLRVHIQSQPGTAGLIAALTRTCPPVQRQK
jgi:uroporphyrinogen III methyltransferase / synthase